MIGTVEVVNDDNTVTVTVRGDRLASLPASPSYDPRAVGDRVVVEFSGGQAHVVGRAAGAPPATEQPWAHGLVNTAPGSGFQEAASVWVNPSTREVRYVRAAPAPVATTGTLTVSAVGLATYRGGELVGDDRAEQGTWAGIGPHVGLFLFGNAFGSLAGKTITGMRVRLHRRNSGGIIAGVRIHLGLHGHATAPTSASGSTVTSVTPIGTLARNETRTFTVPASWGVALRDGTARGVGVYHPSDNAEMDTATLYIDWSS